MRPMQAPSGQLVHHLQRGADACWRGQAPWGSQGPQHPSRHSSSHPIPAEEHGGSQATPSPGSTHLSISRLQGPRMAGQTLTAGPETPTFLRRARHWGAGGSPTAQPGGRHKALAHHAQPGPILPPPVPASSWCLLTSPCSPVCAAPCTQHRAHKAAPSPAHLPWPHVHLPPRPDTMV